MKFRATGESVVKPRPECRESDSISRALPYVLPYLSKDKGV